MKKMGLVFLSLCLTAFIASAQGLNNSQMLRRLGLTDDQISQIAAIQQQALPEIQAAQADMRQAKKQLAQLLVDPKADPKEVDRLVHAATDAEARVRVAQIRREMAIRQLIGDRKWQKLVLYLRVRRALVRAERESALAGNRQSDNRQAAAAGPDTAGPDQSPEKTQALLQEMLDVLGEDSTSPTR